MVPIPEGMGKVWSAPVDAGDKTSLLCQMTHESIVLAAWVGLARVHHGKITSEAKMMTPYRWDPCQVLPVKVSLTCLRAVCFDRDQPMPHLGGLRYHLLDGFPRNGFKHVKIVAALRRIEQGGSLQDILVEIP